MDPNKNDNNKANDGSNQQLPTGSTQEDIDGEFDFVSEEQTSPVTI